ncbi:unnamed protein product [Rotaria sp. Silwood2]|nr:unnamed protein product [Rotaria sp. Silwood2]CAF3398278.1 unnamed protein product [Rotaria sp. Silwood2]CAF4482632.1 unnamed protein product [Rotaria sp. Silwood2]CAF4574189.1 unnamed protein product [Rotaria sp. Silwood2]
MNFKQLLPVLIVSISVGLALGIKSHFLETVKNSSLLHHKETNTVWAYLGTYAQTENTVNFILEIPVFQFMCDVFPASMAFAMQACTRYRSRVLDNGSARRLNELIEAHMRGREKRQVIQAFLTGSAIYAGYKIIGDLFRGIQQVISFAQVNESEISYELQEDDFNFVVEADADYTIGRNESIDLDSILPKIVGHARIENFFAIPTNFSEKKMDLYKITRLPLFVDERKAAYTANLPVYLSFGQDGSSSDSSNDGTVVVKIGFGKVVVSGRT